MMGVELVVSLVCVSLPFMVLCLRMFWLDRKDISWDTSRSS
jgi:hypothetical protein